MAGPDVPARIVVTDDLRRSRVTVFFRLVLFIPHLVWLILWTIAAVLCAIANWFATLVTGRPPEALYRFLAAYVRYATHVSAFLLLAGNPFPGFTGAAGSYPIDVEIAPRERQHRLKTVFRIVLAIPALALAGAIRNAGAGAGAGGSGHGTYRFGVDLGLLAACALLGWFASLVRGRMPQGLRNAIAWGLGYGAQVNAYVFLLSDRYPNTDPGATGILGIPPEHPIRLRVDDDLRRSRLRVFFRLFLFIPHLVWLVLWGIAVLVAVILNWFATLALGRSPGPLHRFLSAYLRYQTHVFAFIGLVADPWPGFLGRPGYPVDLELPGPERQHRLKTLFRIFLAVPAFFVNSGLSGLAALIAFLGWFAALVTGQMPTGFRNVGAWALRYALQLDAYLYLVTDRYPYSGPEAGEAAEPEIEELEPPPLPA